jgi:UDP-2-acetamido-3-amino-2,3-dideoxy-glucuronate N-acetyltransferase
MKRIGVVGAGYWGKNLLRNLSELKVLTAICEVEPNNPHLIPYHSIELYTDYYAFLKKAHIDAVAISTPATAHYQMALKALEAGIDVYVEKPLALTVREGENLVNMAEKKNRVLMVGHILQYHPAVLKLQSMISSGELGRIQYIYSHRLNIGKLRTEENILWSFAPHDISAILMLVGSDPVRVTSMGGDYVNKGIYDTTLTTLVFDDGVKGHIFVSWLHPFKEQKLVVVGSEAMAVFDDVSAEKLTLYPHKIDWREGKLPIAQKAEHKVVPVEGVEPLKEELKHFLDCIEKRKRPKTDGREGLRVLKVLDAAESSLSSGLIPGVLSRHEPYPGCTIHDSTFIDEYVKIGKGSKIWHFSHILKGSVVGENCIIGQNVVIGPDVTIGDRCKIQNNVSVYKGVTLENEVFCGPSCVFTNVYNPRAFVDRKHEFRPTLVKQGATIGANASIICGITIGKYAMIGAGAVVKEDVPAYAVVAGVPARNIGWACRCGTTLKFIRKKAKCTYCGNRYALEKNELQAIKEM